MCTSLTLPLPDGTRLFGRTLDWHEHFRETILHTPQGFPLRTKGADAKGAAAPSRHAFLGMGTEVEGYPLMADGLNDAGLCMAGLRFAAACRYLPLTATPPDGVVCLAPWEVIPYVLGFCATLAEARQALRRARVVARPFLLSAGGEMPLSPLHWHISDSRGESLVLEATARGLEIYDAPLGVMTNDPTYPEQTAAYERAARTGVFLPSGYDSTTRFVRAAHLRQVTAQTLAHDPHTDPVSAFFGMAAELSPPEGAVPAAEGNGWQTTLYTACMDGARGRYVYTTAACSEVHTVLFSDISAPTQE